jgi:hypothetical protein
MAVHNEINQTLAARSAAYPIPNWFFADHKGINRMSRLDVHDAPNLEVIAQRMLGSFSRNVGWSTPIFSANVVPEPWMLSGRPVGPLHLWLAAAGSTAVPCKFDALGSCVHVFEQMKSEVLKVSRLVLSNTSVVGRVITVLADAMGKFPK